ncbi:MAG: 6-phosphogluconolactonase [Planctomycetia bacterium]|nr:6-phosphogluconolactonase [Planctomycetia bacterium]
MHEQMMFLDWLVMGIFFAVMIGIGVVSTYLIRNTNDYFTGSGKMPWWLLGVSHHVSGYSAVAFTAYAAIAYNTGFTIYIWWAVPISFACFFGIFFIVSRWSRLRTHYNIESPLEYLSIRYDVPTQQILAWWGVLLKILDVGAKWVAVSLVIVTFAPGISFAQAVLISVLLGLFYSTLGGLWAGTLTDFAMFLVQLVAGLTIFIIVLLKLGGISALWTIWDQLPAGHSDFMAGDYGTWTCILGLTIINILGYNGGTWNLAQRYIAAPQGSDAKKAAILSASLYLIWPLILFFPMWACPLLIPDIPADQQAQSYSMLVIQFLPPGLTGLMLAALISHTLTMTTADATAITAVLVRDVIPKLWKKAKNFTEKESLFLARFITLIFMALTAVVALTNSLFGGILGLILGWFSALLGPVSIAMILGLLPAFRRCGSCAANSAIAAGIFVFALLKVPECSLFTKLSDSLNHPYLLDQLSFLSKDAGSVILFPTLVSFVVYISVGLFNRKPVKAEADKLLKSLSSDLPPCETFKVDTLCVEIYANRVALGLAASSAASKIIRETILQKGSARVLFAAAPSQNDFLKSLRESSGIDWSKVTALHMDEYIGLDKNAPQKFSHYLHTHLFQKKPFANVYYIDDGSLSSPEKMIERYEKILTEAPLDLVCMGIGENGHIAFNDPEVADFNDDKAVKIVDLDETCRQQQVNDGCFATFEDVPRQAITLTIPTLFSAKQIICVVPGTRKRQAVCRSLLNPISPDCPASILRKHSHAVLYVDTDSCDILTK